MKGCKVIPLLATRTQGTVAAACSIGTLRLCAWLPARTTSLRVVGRGLAVASGGRAWGHGAVGKKSTYAMSTCSHCLLVTAC